VPGNAYHTDNGRCLIFDHLTISPLCVLCEKENLECYDKYAVEKHPRMK